MKWIRNKWLYFFDLHSNKNIVLFGLLLCALFLAFIVMFQWDVVVLSILIAVQLIGLVFKRILRVEFATMTLITYPIGSIVSFFIIGLVFYLVITPIGFFRNKNYKPGWVESIEKIDKSKMNE